jgi:hypothetical protein
MRYSCVFLIIFASGMWPWSMKQPDAPLRYDEGLRLDFVLTGNQDQQRATISELYKVPLYSSGSPQNNPPFDYGTYRILMLNADSNDTLFLKGFSTLFEEWQTTGEATTMNRTFRQSIEMPFPENKITLIVEHRQKKEGFTQLINQNMNPNLQQFKRIIPEKLPHKIIHGTDDPTNKVDILILAEGYTPTETEQFFTDAGRHVDYLFGMPPYKQLKDHFTVRALAVPSAQSGTDDPKRNVWKNTAMNSTFNTFEADRYLESMDTWAIYNYAAALPHDHIMVLVNSKKYGGGGVYNHFSITSAGHKTSSKIFVHELSHGLAGLGDEYYFNEAANSGFFDLKTEPWHPNITTLVDFDSKWQHLVSDTVPIPTPSTHKYENTTGVFEGGGYSAKGIFRPAINCRMKSNKADGFCQVCQESIKEIVIFFTQ